VSQLLDQQGPESPLRRAEAEPLTGNVLTASGALDANRAQTELRLPDGQILHLSTASLLRQAEEQKALREKERVQAGPERVQAGPERVQAEPERVQAGSERVQAEPERVQAGSERVQAGPERARAWPMRVQGEAERAEAEPERARADERVRETSASAESIAIPIIEEQLEVSKRTVVTGKVLLERQDQEYHETLDVPLAVRTFEVERVVLNQAVAAPPGIRQEGNTTIYPLVEERLVITKELILREEIRVTRRDTERRDTRTVTLKRERLNVTRTPGDATGNPGTATGGTEGDPV